MIRTLSLATVFATALALPAMAEDAKSKIEPGTGPTSTMSDAVPQMKKDAEAIEDAGENPAAKPLPAAKAMDESVPSMRPTDAVSGKPDTKFSPDVTAAAAPAQQGASISLTEQEALAWINKPVYSSDEKEIGEVAAFQRDADNKVIGMHADIGGFLGLGETRVSLTPAPGGIVRSGPKVGAKYNGMIASTNAAQFKLQGDRVVLNVTAEQAMELLTVKN